MSDHAMRELLSSDSTLLAQVETAAARRNGAPDDSAALLADVERMYQSYIVLPPAAALPLTVWTIATYMYDSFDAFPYLAILSPAKRCGKTRLTEVLAMVAARARRTVNISEAALFRLIEQQRPTLVLDEAEALAGKSERAEAVRAILNSGNRRDAKVPRCVGANHELVEFSIFCPKVICAIGTCPETIRDRSIVISMQRRKADERVERFLYRSAEPAAANLRERIERFVSENQTAIEAVYEKTDLDFLADRDAEAWAPLFAVLSIADQSRVPELRRAAESLTAQKSADDEDDSLPLRLLADVRAVIRDGEANIFTRELLGRLSALEDSPWAADIQLTARKLARMLRPFGAQPKPVRASGGLERGYAVELLEAAFSRYLALKT